VNTLYFVKRSKKSGYLGCTRAETGEKRLIRALLAEGYKKASRETYLQARVALVGF
jgi:hypothetical protein